MSGLLTLKTSLAQIITINSDSLIFVISFFILSLISGNIMQNYFLFLVLSIDYRFLDSNEERQNKFMISNKIK